MANRVLLNIGNGLRVSAPGFNVLTASQSQLIFDSGWSNLTIWTKGEMASGGTSGNTVYYGKTFPNQPLVVTRIADSAQQFFGSYSLTSNQGGYSLPGYRFMVYSDRMVFYDHALPATTLKYIVWDFNL